MEDTQAKAQHLQLLKQENSEAVNLSSDNESEADEDDVVMEDKEPAFDSTK